MNLQHRVLVPENQDNIERTTGHLPKPRSSCTESNAEAIDDCPKKARHFLCHFLGQQTAFKVDLTQSLDRLSGWY